jgi:hypothetical protein
MSFRLSAAAALVILLQAGPSAMALPLKSGARPEAVPLVTPSFHEYNSRGFRRCMRGQYGPRYFSRVPKAYRWHMSQVCLA